jgi:translation initiation factor 2B subunit (eIF-2B alpha/beta/delta family)
MVTQKLFLSLLEDHESGSSQLLRKCVDWLNAALESGEDPEKIHAQLEQLCHEHSSMALLSNLNQFLHKVSLNAGRIRAWYEMVLKHESAACILFAEHLAGFKNILVHSNSGLLARSLENVNTPLNIFCTESRPAFEGRILAERLTGLGHRVCLVTDMAAFSLLHRIEVLALGCDSITPRGVVNKIGTAALAAAAADHGRKCYVVGTSEKWIDGWHQDFLLRQGPRKEVYDGVATIHVENYYFDLTPLELVNGIFIETGLAQMIYEKAASH